MDDPLYEIDKLSFDNEEWEALVKAVNEWCDSLLGGISFQELKLDPDLPELKVEPLALTTRECESKRRASGKRK